MFGAGEQVLPGSGRGRRGEHHARHLHQELFGRHSRYHSINAVSQQGNRCRITNPNFESYNCAENLRTMWINFPEIFKIVRTRYLSHFV